MGLPVRKLETPYTYRDYRRWPSDERWELIGGVAYNMSSAPRIRHQGVSATLHGLLWNHLRGKVCQVFSAPTDVFFPRVNEMDEDDVDTVVQPDVLVVCDRSKIRTTGVWGAPDLVIEVLSPSTSRKDQREKFDLYQRTGVREYWVVDVNAPWLQQYVRGPDGVFGIEVTFETAGILTSSVLPDVSLDVAELWPDLP